MDALPADPLPALIARLRAGEDAAWTAFVERFAPLLLQAARSVERDPDAAADAFVFTCERLRERNAARLGTFDFDRPGLFETWLRAVALNLCRDARRHRLGRFRPFAALRRLPPLEQRLFRLRHELGFSFDQAYASLAPEFPGLTQAQLSDADAAVTARISARHRWSLLTRRPRLESLDEEREDAPLEVPPAAQETSDPEWLALAQESRARLADALNTLAPEERLLIRLRFERGLTLTRLATMFGYRDVQTADRRIRELLRRLRRQLEAGA